MKYYRGDNIYDAGRVLILEYGLHKCVYQFYAKRINLGNINSDDYEFIKRLFISLRLVDDLIKKSEVKDFYEQIEVKSQYVLSESLTEIKIKLETAYKMMENCEQDLYERIFIAKLNLAVQLIMECIKLYPKLNYTNEDREFLNDKYIIEMFEESLSKEVERAIQVRPRPRNN